MPKSLEPHSVDIHVGKRVAARRGLLNMSQKDLADHVGYSYQQIQKYEKGLNRVSASVLYEFCQALDVPITFFFEDLAQKVRPVKKSALTGDPTRDSMRVPDIIRLVREFERIDDPESRQTVLQFIRGAAAVLSRDS